MSQIVTTKLGRFRRVKVSAQTLPNHGDEAWLWECCCGEWCYLSDAQWNGSVSVDHASDGCKCGYHETHCFGAELVAVMQARILMGEPPIDPELPEDAR